MNRHTRRADVREFRRDVHHDHVLTYLVDADAPLDHHPLLKRALAFWRGNIGSGDRSAPCARPTMPMERTLRRSLSTPATSNMTARRRFSPTTWCRQGPAAAS